MARAELDAALRRLQPAAQAAVDQVQERRRVVLAALAQVGQPGVPGRRRRRVHAAVRTVTQTSPVCLLRRLTGDAVGQERRPLLVQRVGDQGRRHSYRKSIHRPTRGGKRRLEREWGGNIAGIPSLTTPDSVWEVDKSPRGRTRSVPTTIPFHDIPAENRVPRKLDAKH